MSIQNIMPPQNLGTDEYKIIVHSAYYDRNYCIYGSINECTLKSIIDDINSNQNFSYSVILKIEDPYLDEIEAHSLSHAWERRHRKFDSFDLFCDLMTDGEWKASVIHTKNAELTNFEYEGKNATELALTIQVSRFSLEIKQCV